MVGVKCDKFDKYVWGYFGLGIVFCKSLNLIWVLREEYKLVW